MNRGGVHEILARGGFSEVLQLTQLCLQMACNTLVSYALCSHE